MPNDTPRESTRVLLTDVADPNQLRVYIATAQVAFMGSRFARSERMSQNDIAELWHITPDPADLPGRRPDDLDDHVSDEDPETTELRRKRRRSASSAFAKALKTSRTAFLRRLETVIVDHDPEMANTGGLVAPTARLSGVRDEENMSAPLSACDAPFLYLEIDPDQQIITLLQANALLAEYVRAGANPKRVTEQRREVLKRVVQRLILIGGLPPTPNSVDALLLLGSLSMHAFNEIRPQLHRALRSPLGFRVWRAISAIVVAIKKRHAEDTPTGTDIHHWVHGQLDMCERLRGHSLYPARSLDLELAISIPLQWSPPSPAKEDWAGNILRRRAQDRRATLRERGTAAFGLWERAVGTPYEDDARQEVLALIMAFRTESPTRQGLQWVADTLEQNLKENKAIVTTWPDVHDPCKVIVADAATRLDATIPDRILDATKVLFTHALIKNAGVYRRRAIDTLRAGGWSQQIMPALGALLTDERTQPWLRCRALFAIGFMQERKASRQILTRALTTAWESFPPSVNDRAESIVRVIELHAAVFAIGDAFGDPSAATEANLIRERLDGTLGQMVARACAGHDRHLLVLVARALAYLLATTAHVRSDEAKVMLEQLAAHADPSTSIMSRWGIDRFTPDGAVGRSFKGLIDSFDLPGDARPS